MTTANLISQEDLKAWLGYRRPADIERWLIDNRVPYFFGRGGSLCTTQTAIDEKLTGKPGDAARVIEF